MEKTFHEILAFDRLCFPMDYWKEEDWAELLKDEKTILYTRRDNEKLIGLLAIYDHGPKSYVKIMTLAVHPKHRGKGLAASLMEEMHRDMDDKGRARYIGETRRSNQSMRQLFERLGYTPWAIVPLYYTNPIETAIKYQRTK